jgi:hypothetical protein
MDLVSVTEDSQISWDLNEKSLHTSQASGRYSLSSQGFVALDLPTDHDISDVGAMELAGDDSRGIRASNRALENLLDDGGCVFPADDLDIDDDGNLIERPPQTPAPMHRRVALLSDGTSSQVRRDHLVAGEEPILPVGQIYIAKSFD